MATRVQEALQEARRQGWTAVAGNKHWKLVPPNGLTAEYPRPLVLPHGQNQRDRGASWANFLRGVRDYGDAGLRLADTLDPPNGAPKRAPKAPVEPQWLDPEPQPVAAEPAFSGRVCQVGPAEAIRMLGSLYEGQRPRRDAEIQKWADDMRAGRWTLSNDAVTFDVEGRLINGQHRLHAVIRSGAAVPFLVVRGLPTEAYESMDTGRKRRFGDLLRSEGEKDVTNQAGVVNRLLAYVRTGDLGASIVTTTPQLAQFYRAHRPAIREATAAGHRLYPKTRFSVAHTGALIFLWNAVDEAATKDFLDELHTGSASPDEPSAQLREAFIRRMGTPLNRRSAPIVYAALAAKAWNLYMRRDRVSTLRWSRVENFPPIWDPEEVLPDLLAKGM